MLGDSNTECKYTIVNIPGASRQIEFLRYLVLTFTITVEILNVVIVVFAIFKYCFNISYFTEDYKEQKSQK